jgi:hypothetical protein
MILIVLDNIEPPLGEILRGKKEYFIFIKTQTNKSKEILLKQTKHDQSSKDNLETSYPLAKG